MSYLPSAKHAIVAALLLFPLLSHEEKVIGIADGDTLTLLVDQRPLKIRLANIDAPEERQAWGQRSKRSLSVLCWGKDAQYNAQTIDRYGRTVAVVYCDGVEVNRVQVERGLAWVHPKYNKDRGLPALERQVRKRRTGLWADADPLPPWEFRRSNKNGSPQ